MGQPESSPHVIAHIVDENTISVDGVTFVRKCEDEVLLRPIYSLSDGATSLAPVLQCSSCGYRAPYFSWYHLTGFRQRYVRHCPGCGLRILGVLGHGPECDE